MDPSRPLVLAAARYASSNDAIRDYQIVWGVRHGGTFDHMSVAVLAALLVVAPAVDATVAAAADGLPGAKGIATHLRHDHGTPGTPRHQLPQDRPAMPCPMSTNPKTRKTTSMIAALLAASHSRQPFSVLSALLPRAR